MKGHLKYSTQLAATTEKRETIISHARKSFRPIDVVMCLYIRVLIHVFTTLDNLFNDILHFQASCPSQTYSFSVYIFIIYHYISLYIIIYHINVNFIVFFSNALF